MLAGNEILDVSVSEERITNNSTTSESNIAEKIIESVPLKSSSYKEADQCLNFVTGFLVKRSVMT